MSKIWCTFAVEMNKTGLLISAGLLLAYVWKQKKRAAEDGNLPPTDPGRPDPNDPSWGSRSQIPDGLQINPQLTIRNLKSSSVEVKPSVEFKNFSNTPISIYGIEGDFGVWEKYPFFEKGNKPPQQYTSSRKCLFTIQGGQNYTYDFGGYWGWIPLSKEESQKLGTFGATMYGGNNNYTQNFAKADLAFWYDYQPEHEGWMSKDKLYQAICRDYKTRIIK